MKIEDLMKPTFEVYAIGGKTTVEVVTKADAIRIAKEYAINFLESIKDYERESGDRICFDERTPEELLNIFETSEGLC